MPVKIPLTFSSPFVLLLLASCWVHGDEQPTSRAEGYAVESVDEPVKQMTHSAAHKAEKQALQVAFNDGIFDLKPTEGCEKDGSYPRFYCPLPDPVDFIWKCIRATDLCNRIPDCPDGSDEAPTFCLFHQATLSEIAFLKQIIVKYVLDKEQRQSSVQEGEF